MKRSANGKMAAVGLTEPMVAIEKIGEVHRWLQNGHTWTLTTLASVHADGTHSTMIHLKTEDGYELILGQQVGNQRMVFSQEQVLELVRPNLSNVLGKKGYERQVDARDALVEAHEAIMQGKVIEGRGDTQSHLQYLAAVGAYKALMDRHDEHQEQYDSGGWRKAPQPESRYIGNEVSGTWSFVPRANEEQLDDQDDRDDQTRHERDIQVRRYAGGYSLTR